MKVFIGSSGECLKHLTKERFKQKLANAIGCKVKEVTYWREDHLWKNLSGAFDSIQNFALDYDYAVLVGFPDDIIQSRGKEAYVPRDNVIFELGFFLGQLGPKRTYFMSPAKITNSAGVADFKILSDLLGSNAVLYSVDMKGTSDQSKWKPNFSAAVKKIGKAVSQHNQTHIPNSDLRLENRIKSLTAGVSAEPDPTRKINELSIKLPDLIRLKSRRKNTEIIEVVEDLCVFFNQVPDLVSVEQLVEAQTDVQVKRVWVYASQALEFSATATTDPVLKQTLEMVTNNIANRNVSYTYFLDPTIVKQETIVDRVIGCAEQLGLNVNSCRKKLAKHLTVVYLPTSRFLTNFTLHFDGINTDGPFEVYMSAVNKNRNDDIGYKLENDHAQRIYKAIKSIFDKDTRQEFPIYRLHSR